MTQANNPAARLHKLLVDFVSVTANTSPLTLGEAWTKVLGAAENNPRELFERLAELQSLLVAVRDAVGLDPKLQPELHLRSFKKIESLVQSTDLNASWTGYKAAVSDIVLVELEMTAHALSYSQSEATIDPNDFVSLRADLDAAYESIAKAKIDSEARQAMLSVLDAMHTAISRYRTAGIDAFWTAWTQMLGTLLSANAQPGFKEAFQQPEVGPVRTLVTRAAKYAAMAKDTATIVNAVSAISKGVEFVRSLGPGIAS